MRRINWKTKLIALFISLSCIIYFGHYLIFNDYKYIFRILIAQLGFLPISTLLVTFVLNKLLSNRQKKERLNKLNMVIGTFFSEVGTELLKKVTKFQVDIDKKEQDFRISDKWTKKDFKNLKSNISNKNFELKFESKDVKVLKEFLMNKRSFMLTLLQNPNLLEHQSFTDLLWAIFHLTEELANRQEVDSLSKDDLEHIGGDVSRVYKILILEWINYVEHLQNDYPYLFSLAVRTNPFDKNAKAEIK
ncbi:hypothetical protein OW763_01030 [Clostridium aestuarii]|uniref:DUF4760 domain-containing protein n=1 Tax=Clostridium aestuarii TaxID=338193 RepID=A0ABT4CVD6_9CLOT|nr:hypothetical protein [Clostridium aestuarii]MCY6482938.1 hypothetical protein [Clostridium aestuarii]